ncbi:cytochrome c3 family protein [Carboxydothermus hydrogenoformans]|uniref:Cytochrome c domain-containing protein n=1 Tax=Carboxydothermus hydrogenoformans (strain ATCC BAA-161 / DSM 6008 / Z-2901) TaxID=246194 RepID=Q3AFF2_CARHZ|nr:cytochrome c3 family protein [Carboxydothermus hydrogenoformans]ABB15483.1 hypothetical protein CHY_0260 [Carboxydothermus hydrogenoformans Z-2901]
MRKGLWVLVAAVLLLLVASPVLATDQYAKDTGKPCSYCHQVPTQGTLAFHKDAKSCSICHAAPTSTAQIPLTERGVLFMQNGKKLAVDLNYDPLTEANVVKEFARVSGLSESAFGKVSGNITKQRLAYFLMVALKAQGEVAKVTANDLKKYADYTKAASANQKALVWAVKKGYLSARKAGSKLYLDPTAAASRTEVVKAFNAVQAKYPRVLPAPTAYAGTKKCQSCHGFSKFSATWHPNMVKTPDFFGSMLLWSLNDKFQASDVRYVINSPTELLFVGKDYKYMPYAFDKTENQWVADSHTQNWLVSCAKCHVTGYPGPNGITGTPYSVVGNTYKELFTEPGIGCEACHGPGALHAATGDPTKILGEKDGIAASATCEKCHEGAHHRGGEYNDEYAIAGVSGTVYGKHGISLQTIQQNSHGSVSCLECHSQDYRTALEDYLKANPGKTAADFNATVKLSDFKLGITCVTCHSPHSEKGYGKQLRNEPNELCMECHTGEGFTATSGSKGVHHPQKEVFTGQLGASFTALGIPEKVYNPMGSAECVTCHMPNGYHYFKAGKPTITIENVTVKNNPDLGNYRNNYKASYNSCSVCHDAVGFDANAVKAWTDKVDTRVNNILNQLKTTYAAAYNDPNYKYADTLAGIVSADASHGIHNTALTELLLNKAEEYLKQIPKQ